MEERRNPVRRISGALICAAALAGATLSAAACELPPGQRVDSGRISLSYWTEPAPIAVGRPFTLELAVCAPEGELKSGRVRFDAHMPEHRHGMNYRVKVSRLEATRFRSEGWLFHMPGRWEFVFELGAERLTHSVRIE